MELHRHAGPLYLKDLNGCNGERKCSFIGTPISFHLTSRTNSEQILRETGRDRGLFDKAPLSSRFTNVG